MSAIAKAAYPQEEKDEETGEKKPERHWVFEREIEQLRKNLEAGPKAIGQETRVAFDQLQRLIPFDELHNLLSEPTIKALEQIDDYHIKESYLTIIRTEEELRNKAGAQSADLPASTDESLALLSRIELDISRSKLEMIETQVQELEKEAEALLKERQKQREAEQKAALAKLEEERLQVQKSKEVAVTPPEKSNAIPDGPEDKTNDVNQLALELQKKGMTYSELADVLQDKGVEERQIRVTIMALRRAQPGDQPKSLPDWYRNSVKRERRKKKPKTTDETPENR
jgi:hypothetical protein